MYLTNRLHFAVRLFSNRSEMTSKCGKNKKVAHEALYHKSGDGFWSSLNFSERVLSFPIKKQLFILPSRCTRVITAVLK